MNDTGPVFELRVAITAENYSAAVHFYRDVLGLPLVEAWDRPDGSGSVLAAGKATLEVLSADQAESIDRIETGRPIGAPIRLALEVADSVGTAERLEGAGAERVGGPVATPWDHRNVRLKTPEGIQMTLYTVMKPEG
jgi:lactoylglutathione lyase